MILDRATLIKAIEDCRLVASSGGSAMHCVELLRALADSVADPVKDEPSARSRSAIAYLEGNLHQANEDANRYQRELHDSKEREQRLVKLLESVLETVDEQVVATIGPEHAWTVETREALHEHDQRLTVHVAWIAKRGNDVLHLSKRDGWEVQVVLTEETLANVGKDQRGAAPGERGQPDDRVATLSNAGLNPAVAPHHQTEPERSDQSLAASSESHLNGASSTFEAGAATSAGVPNAAPPASRD